jgi:hypothetical protein
MLQRFVDELIDKYVVPFATVDEKVLSVGVRNGQVHLTIIFECRFLICKLVSLTTRRVKITLRGR